MNKVEQKAVAIGDRPAVDAPPLRKIIHVDMDAFYASVEQRDNPELRGKAVAVGGERERGVVAAASYEARRFGIRSAMPSVTARRRCPDLIFVKPRFEVYRAISQEIREIFFDFTPLVEPLSLDEAYLDVTENLKGVASATLLAQEIRQRIRRETNLTASAGVSYNKFLAKLASGQRKPDGLFVITPKMGPAFVEELPISLFHGVGPATTAKMQRLGIYSGRDLKARSLAFLQQHFGKSGPYYYWISRGLDQRPVKPDRVRKSLGAENTFFEDLWELAAMERALQPILDKVWQRSTQAATRGRTVTLKVKYADFEQITRSRTLLHPVGSRAELEEVSLALLTPLLPPRRGVRLLGITLSSLLPPEEQTAEMPLLL